MKWLSLADLRDIICELITPNTMCESVFDIDLDGLHAQGYRTIFTDVDNTILALRDRDLTLDYLNWIEDAKRMGFRVLLISNNSSAWRIQRVATQADVNGVFFAFKPSVASIRDLANRYQVDLTQSIMIGDQVLTDVLTGNWVKAHSVLVEPIDKKLSIIKLIQQDVERWLLKKFRIPLSFAASGSHL